MGTHMTAWAVRSFQRARLPMLPAAVTIAALVAAPAAVAHLKPPHVLSPTSSHLGRTYAQWSAAAWRWELEQPNKPSSPVVDPNPGTKTSPEQVNCRLGQSGKVWFLGGIIISVLGVIGMYIGRLFSEAKSRPQYFVRRIYEKSE